MKSALTIPFLKVLPKSQPTRQEIIAEARIPSAKERRYIEYTLRVPIHRFREQKSWLAAGSKLVWASFRACHITASMVQSTPFKLEDTQNPDREVTEETALEYLSCPNPFDSWAELLYMWTFHMKLVGEAYWLKDEINLLGQPKNIFPLIPCFVKKLTHPTLGISGYEYTVNGKVIKISTEEMIYFRRPHPTRVLEGIGDVEPSESLYNEHINRAVFEEKFIEQGASPSGILTLKETNPDEDDWNKVKDLWRKEYEGKDNIGKTAMLTGEWSYHQLGLNMAEMQSIEKENQNVQYIFMNHGVPLSIAGVEKATSLATARQDEINFRKFEVAPLINMLVRKLNQEGQLFESFLNGRIRLSYDMSGLINIEQVMKDFIPLVKVGGMTPNQLRELAGLQKVDNPFLDQYFLPSGTIPIEMAGLTDIPQDALPAPDEPTT